MHRGTTSDVKCWSYEISNLMGDITLHNDFMRSLWAIAGHRPAAMNNQKKSITNERSGIQVLE
jgi:hypothetical protein